MPSKQVILMPMADAQPRPAKTFVQTTVRIDPDVYAAAQRAAAAEGVSVNEWIVRAMREKAERGRG